MQDYLIEFASIPWESPMPGMRHKTISRHGKRLRLVEYSQAMPPHWCEKGHVGYILEGSLEIEFTDGARGFAAGEGLFIPGGAQHRHMARALSQVVRAVLVEDV